MRFDHCETRALYLATEPDPTFVTVHLPGSDSQKSVGVVLCPPFGWEEEGSHRSRRAWANALAAAGISVVRLDLPGTGDSGGSLDRPDRLQCWISAVGAAASWLRDEFGCSRVCGLGIGFGGALAWLAAAEGGPIDDLVLWGAPSRGRRLIREVRVAAQLEIDASGADSPADGGDLVDVSGQVLTEETVDSLSAVDLRDWPLPDPGRRRALVFQRTGAKADQDLAALLRSSGVSVTVSAGDSYDLLMRYVQKSVVPHAQIARSIEWLAIDSDDDDGRPPLGGGSWDAVPTTASVELTEDGVAIRETPVSVELPSGDIRAVITEPVDAESAGVCAVFFSGGSDRRIGPNRMWVDTARRWAASGVTGVRIDLPGAGDSDGDERLLDALQAHYDPAQVTRAIELLDALAVRGLPGQFLLAGFCSGAYRALHVAIADDRVVGIIPIGLHFFHWRWWLVNVRNSWLAVREPMSGDSKVKLQLLPVLKRGLHAINTAHHAVVVLGQGFRNRGERVIEQLGARGIEMVFILKRTSYAHEQLVMPRRRARLRRIANLQVRTIPGDDAKFRPVVSQRFVRDALDDALPRIIGVHEAASPTVSTRSGVVAAPHPAV